MIGGYVGCTGGRKEAENKMNMIPANAMLVVTC